MWGQIGCVCVFFLSENATTASLFLCGNQKQTTKKLLLSCNIHFFFLLLFLRPRICLTPILSFFETSSFVLCVQCTYLDDEIERELCVAFSCVCVVSTNESFLRGRDSIHPPFRLFSIEDQLLFKTPSPLFLQQANCFPSDSSFSLLVAVGRTSSSVLLGRDSHSR